MDRIQHLVPSSDGGDDFVRVLGPSEGSWISVGFGEEALDGGLQSTMDRNTRVESLLRQLGEITFDGEPRRGGGSEMERPTRMTDQPFTNLGMFVS